MKNFFIFIFLNFICFAFGQTAEEFYKNGFEKLESQDYLGAISDCNSALEIEPKKVQVYYLRGLAKYKLEDYKGAINDFNMALKLRLTEIIEASIFHLAMLTHQVMSP